MYVFFKTLNRKSKQRRRCLFRWCHCDLFCNLPAQDVAKKKLIVASHRRNYPNSISPPRSKNCLKKQNKDVILSNKSHFMQLIAIIFGCSTSCQVQSKAVKVNLDKKTVSTWLGQDICCPWYHRISVTESLYRAAPHSSQQELGGWPLSTSLAINLVHQPCCGDFGPLLAAHRLLVPSHCLVAQACSYAIKRSRATKGSCRDPKDLLVFKFCHDYQLTQNI